ncbi:hypothetical protein MRX96_019437 [Rhipicephalus microplus]
MCPLRIHFHCLVVHLVGSFGSNTRRYYRLDLTCWWYIVGSIVRFFGTIPFQGRRTVFQAVSTGHDFAALALHSRSLRHSRMSRHRDVLLNAAWTYRAAAAPADLDCALGLDLLRETMVVVLRQEHVKGNVPCGWAPGVPMQLPLRSKR